MNGDGVIDLVGKGTIRGDISIATGDGTGAFTPAVRLSANSGYAKPTVGDFNGDGKLDIAVRNSTGSGGGFLIYFSQ